METEKSKPEGGSKIKTYLKWFLVIALCVGISWGMLTLLMPPKAVYAVELTKINNTVSHMNDRETGLDNLATYQDSKINTLSDNTDRKFEETDSQIKTIQNSVTGIETDMSGVQSDLTGVQGNLTDMQKGLSDAQTGLTGVQNDVTTLQSDLAAAKTDISNKADQTAVDTLSSQISSRAAGLQITPSTSGNTISLVIQTDAAQILAFRVELRPTTNMVQQATLDGSLQALYTTAPVTLTAGSINVTANYQLYFSPTTSGGDGKYHLGQIVFITPGTALAAGTQTKTLTYTTTGTYEILITPVDITGYSTGSW